MPNNINYNTFFREYLNRFIDKQNLSNFINKEKNKIQELSIFLRNIRNLLENRIQYLYDNGNLNGKSNITIDELDNILYKNLPNDNTKINGLLLDYCYLDDPDNNNHLLYLMLECLTIENVVEDNYLRIYFKEEILSIFIAINKLIENKLLSDLIEKTFNDNDDKNLFYYNDRDLFIVGGSSTSPVFNLKNDTTSNENYLSIGYNSEHENGEVFLAFNDDNLISYKFSLNELHKYGSGLLEIIFKNNISKITKENIEYDKLIKGIINKEVESIEQGNFYTKSFGMGNIEDINSEKSIDKICESIHKNFLNKFIFNELFIKYKTEEELLCLINDSL